ncbi:MAG: monovalent cation/H+ antiporter subunit D [Acinetobacter sp.]|jgi:multicomponent K+:H+ antiporter subunit D|nr:MAG: monovalent cation/H+ antiporter subunit D [Acinetobacter sp.]
MTFLTDFWLTHFPILSILLPALTSISLILLGNPGSGSLAQDWRQPVRHAISWTSAALGLVLAILMLNFASSGQIKIYQLSEWTAPFGIVLVVDRLAAMMVLLTYSLALPILWYASAEWDTRGRYFHTMLHFLLMGICGAFLTGDLFNLFVFFEILLMASYVLLLHSQSKARFALGVHYVILNLLASALFLIGLGLIYGNVGSLNMADVARLLPTLDSDSHQMALTGAMLLFVVFGIKAAMLPVGFWLPKVYAVAATPIAAIFALMTKVGIYAILRVHGTVFADSSSLKLFSACLLPIGIATTLYGVIGAIGTERLRRFIGFMVLSSIGTILIALALATTQAWAAALYYLIHSTLIAACFYLLAEWVIVQRGDEFKDHFKLAPAIKQNRLVSVLFFIMALMMAGLPPFSGFIGKVMLLQSTHTHTWQIAIILMILLVSILSILAFVRVGFILFWRAEPPEDNPQSTAFATYQALPDQPTARLDMTIYLLLAGLLVYAVCAEPVYRYTYATAQQLQQPQHYQDILLKKDATQSVISVQPFDPEYLPVLRDAKTDPDQYQDYIPYLLSDKTLAGKNIAPAQTQQEGDAKPMYSPDQHAKILPMEDTP